MLHSYLLSSILTLSITYTSFYGVQVFWKTKFLNQEERKPRMKQTHVVPVYMWDIYNNGMNSSDVDVVKGIYPKFLGAPVNSRQYRNHRGKQLEFDIPRSQPDEILVGAEVRITRNKIQNRTTYFQIYIKSEKWVFLDEKKVSNDNEWTSLRTPIENIKPGPVTFLILTLFENLAKTRGSDFSHPVLLLSYLSKTDLRKKRSLDDYEEKTNRIWEKEVYQEEISKMSRRVKSSCRKKPLYIKFSEIDYDSWIVAPTGYEAFQCVGKCTFPVSEHLSPTKHAILQTLIHNIYPSRASRACCVPTRLDPISILYVDENGILTYRFRYRDMVVAECGCR